MLLAGSIVILIMTLFVQGSAACSAVVPFPICTQVGWSSLFHNQQHHSRLVRSLMLLISCSTCFLSNVSLASPIT